MTPRLGSVPGGGHELYPDDDAYGLLGYWMKSDC